MKMRGNVTFRKILKFIVFVAIGIAICYFCSVFGYLQGYTDGTNAPVNAVYNVSVLESIRSGNNETAIKLLDTQLDVNIIYHWTLKNRGRSIFDVMGFGQFDRGFMENVAAYRRQLPLNGSDKEINNAIASVLHQYSTGKIRKKHGKPNKEDAPGQKTAR
jgi:hypothetical protein